MLNSQHIVTFRITSKINIGRTVRFSNTYFGNVLSEWNNLTDDIRNSKSIGEFKSKLLKIIRSKGRSVFGIYDIADLCCIAKLLHPHSRGFNVSVNVLHKHSEFH